MLRNTYIACPAVIQKRGVVGSVYSNLIQGVNFPIPTLSKSV